MKAHLCFLAVLFCAAPALAQGGDASVAVHRPEISNTDKGRHVIQDVTLASSVASYTLRYDVIERKEAPDQVTWVKWAPTLGYAPLGICGPSECLWYNQGFFLWTFDGFNIQDTKARFRVVREYGQDAMVEYVWDTPKVTATARFAITSGSDKLLFFGSYQPKTEIREVKLRLMSYPATFAQPWQRSATTATRTLTTGSGVALDLQKERWVLLEDTLPGRKGDGSAGLLLGDPAAFDRVSLSEIGGYAEYVDIALKPGRRDFALALYEFPTMPDPEETRAYFRRVAGGEAEAIARMAAGDLDRPLPALPLEPARAALIARADEDALRRPSEIWRPDAAPLAFPWAARLAEPVRVGLLCPRWRAFETMELGRRLAMDVRHLYFDGTSALVAADYWPYRTQTGIGPLSAGVAERQALALCADASRDVVLIAGVRGSAVPARVRAAVVAAVRAGKGLMLAGDGSALEGWPKELTAQRDDSLVAPALAALPWASLPGLREGDPGRAGTDAPLKGYRFGSGRVVVFTAGMGSYSALVPRSAASEGLEGATDRVLALHAAALLAAAGRKMPATVTLAAGPPPRTPVTLGAAAPAESATGVALSGRVVRGNPAAAKWPSVGAPSSQVTAAATAALQADGCRAVGGNVVTIRFTDGAAQVSPVPADGAGSPETRAATVALLAGRPRAVGGVATRRSLGDGAGAGTSGAGARAHWVAGVASPGRAVGGNALTVKWDGATAPADSPAARAAGMMLLAARAGAPDARPVARVEGAGAADALVRVQDDLDNTLLLAPRRVIAGSVDLNLPALPAMRSYFVDVLLRDAQGRGLGFASMALPAPAGPSIDAVQFSPAARNHPAAPPAVSLVNGGTLSCQAAIGGAEGKGPLVVRWEVRDCFDRLLAATRTSVGADGAAKATLLLGRPVTVAHRLDTALLAGDRTLAVRRDRFTIPVPYPYDDFTFLLWSYPGGEPVLRRTDRACYDMGADMMDLCHMRGYTDEGAAREYALSTRSGLRLVPYVTRIAGEATDARTLKPGLFDAAWRERERSSIEICTRQAAPYRPAAYTLGDENFLSNAEACGAPETMAAFQGWLKARYGTINALNAAWKTGHASFDAIAKPMWLEEAARQKESFAPWFDHRDFMDTAFAQVHEALADAVRKEDPGAKVGWDGLLGYHWNAGYDFHKLTRGLELNQVYTTDFPQGDFVASLARPDALRGEWGNAVADNEAGFSAFPWHNLFKGHNSAWWWTSWGCDYIPFNPDASLSKMGEWHFRAAAEVRSGPGRLLLHARRDASRVAILYNQADLFAATLADKVTPGAAPAGGAWMVGHKELIRALDDLGYGYRHVAAAQVETDPASLSAYQVLVLPLATCLSDKAVVAIRAFVENGGTVIADGRAGILTENGVPRAERPLDALFGVKSPAGMAAFAQRPQSATVGAGADAMRVDILEPGTTLAGGQGAPVPVPLHITNAVGKGKAILVNVAFGVLAGLRGQKKDGPSLEMFGQRLEEAGVQPHARLQTAGGRARSVRQSLFTDGGLRYLGIEQDILQPGLQAQKAALMIGQPAFVYDVRAGKPVAEGKTASWEVEISRGRPRLFALLPYRVTGVRAGVAAAAKPGETLPLRVGVDVAPGKAQFHVVHVDVYAPGSDRPHRQYSQNIACAGGVGQGSLPFALNDAPGVWRLVFRDTATGVTAEKVVKVGGR